MESLPVHVFKDSLGPFLALLNEHKVRYVMRDARSGVPMASSGVIEILQSAAMWAALAAVAVAFIRARAGRKITITTKDGKVVHTEGFSTKDFEQVLAQAKNVTAIATKEEKDPTG